MSLSTSTLARLAHGLADVTAAEELGQSVNDGEALATQSVNVVPALIVATATSTTTDFGALAIGDKILHVPAVAGNSAFYSCIAKGTLPVAAVVGDLYVVLRAAALTPALSISL